MIRPNPGKPKPGEASVWAIGTGMIKVYKKRSRMAADFIKQLDGFVGVHQVPERGILWLFDTRKNAIRARQNMDYKGIATGDDIVELFIPESYLGGNK